MALDLVNNTTGSTNGATFLVGRFPHNWNLAVEPGTSTDLKVCFPCVHAVASAMIRCTAFGEMAAQPEPSPQIQHVFLPLLRRGNASDAALLRAIQPESSNGQQQHLWDLKRWHEHSGQDKELSNLISRRDTSWRKWHGTIWPGLGRRKVLAVATSPFHPCPCSIVLRWPEQQGWYFLRMF